MTATKKRKSRHENRICKARGCDRPATAKGFCQTHWRQLRTTGDTRPICPYRPRDDGRVKFGGLRLSSTGAEMIGRKARRAGISIGAAISEVLEEWNTRNPS